MANRPRGRFVQRQRRRVGWEEGPGGSTLTTFTITSQALIGASVAVLQDGLTLVRLRGHLSAFLVSAAAAGDGFHCAIGVGISTVQALGIGITAVPTPIADMDWDGWLYHRFFDVHVGDATAGDIDHGRVDFQVDSKAMRKTQEDSALYAVIQAVEVGTAEMDVFFDSRMLFKLP